MFHNKWSIVEDAVCIVALLAVFTTVSLFTGCATVTMKNHFDTTPIADPVIVTQEDDTDEVIVTVGGMRSALAYVEGYSVLNATRAKELTVSNEIIDWANSMADKLNDRWKAYSVIGAASAVLGLCIGLIVGK